MLAVSQKTRRRACSELSCGALEIILKSGEALAAYTKPVAEPICFDHFGWRARRADDASGARSHGQLDLETVGRAAHAVRRARSR